MSAADLFEASIGDVIKFYRGALEESESCIVASEGSWRQCRAQAEEILRECVSALRGIEPFKFDTSECMEDIRVGCARQAIPISESIRAGLLLWRVTTTVLCKIHLCNQFKSTGEAAALVDALEVLQESINMQFVLAALDHEDPDLGRHLLARNEITQARKTASFTAYRSTGFAAWHLSDREQQVLSGVAMGLSNREIGRKLDIAEGTVKRHMRRIFAKLGATSRVDAINKVGLVRQPPSASVTRLKSSTDIRRGS